MLVYSVGLQVEICAYHAEEIMMPCALSVTAGTILVKKEAPSNFCGTLPLVSTKLKVECALQFIWSTMTF